MNVSFLIAPHSTVVRSLLRLLQYRTTPWTGGVFLVCLGLLEGNQGRPPPHFTSVGFRTEKEKSFLLLRIPADLKGDRRRAVEERADLLRTGGRALQGRAASERERERERERETSRRRFWERRRARSGLSFPQTTFFFGYW